MTLAVQQFGSSQMLTKMRSTVRWAEPQGQEWFTHPPVRGQAVPGGSDAAWTVLVYRATDPRSRFERLMERFTVEQLSPGDSPELAMVTLRWEWCHCAQAACGSEPMIIQS